MSGLNRRQWMALAGATTLGGAWALRPRAEGQGHSAYFGRMQSALKEAGVGAPTLVIDRDKLQANIRQVHQHVKDRLHLRVVNKSLPCLGLLDEVMQHTGTHRQMVFSLPYLQLIAQQRPQADVLLGKPLPVAAAARFYAQRPANAFDPHKQLQWLIDTPQRLHQYRELARGLKQPLRINLEIDVGLHRGGLTHDAELREVVGLLQSEPLLQWSGLMGYDPHTEKIPDLPGLRTSAREAAKARYQHMADMLAASPLRRPREQLTLNTGGSPTYRLHDGSGAANEVAIGSAMVKPSDFDTPLLADLQAACFIATPVLKRAAFQTPHGVEWIGQAVRAWDPNQAEGLFIYGGHWLAKPESPAGLTPSGLIGPSSNQQILLGSGLQALQPDDFVFFRPTQSEAVLQQFGDIAVYSQGRITHWWPVFPAQA